jgi:type I restriction enzyme S subunit
MAGVEKLITEHIDVWTSAIKKRNATGRGSNKKIELTGIKKLRELILELAVRGKLVPQDPSEEPASVLLEKIAEEKAQLIADKKIKKQKPLPVITDEDKPFELPNGWEWEYLANIGHDLGQKTPEKEFSYIDVASINKELGVIGNPTILAAENAPSRARKKVKKGTVIYSTVRPYLLNIAVVNDDFSPEPIASTAFSIIHPFEGILASYIYRYLRSPIFIKYVESVQTGIAYPAINDKQFFAGLIAIPPLAEQHSIVAKVDELMTLCDQLEQQTEQSLTAHQTLVEVLLASLTSDTSTDANNKEDFQTSWQRIAEHFDVLFTTEASIEQLKQTILQLAVMGKLVPQNPNDEPAPFLMERLAIEQKSWLENNLVNNAECKTMLRKLNKLKSVNAPFLLPKSWACVHLIQTSQLLVDCHNKTAPYTDSGIPIIRTTNIREREFRFEGLRYVNEDTYDYWSRRCPPESGDIMFTREAPMGEAAIIPKGVKWCLGQRTMLIRPMHEYVSNKFILLALTEPHLLERASEHAVGLTVKHLRVGDVENLNIPLPPLAEQHRIVSKVDELMALCGQLKARLADAQTTQLHLADAVVENALT